MAIRMNNRIDHHGLNLRDAIVGLLYYHKDALFPKDIFDILKNRYRTMNMQLLYQYLQINKRKGLIRHEKPAGEMSGWIISDLGIEHVDYLNQTNRILPWVQAEAEFHYNQYQNSTS